MLKRHNGTAVSPKLFLTIHLVATEVFVNKLGKNKSTPYLRLQANFRIRLSLIVGE